jgi:hypothetical protein
MKKGGRKMLIKLGNQMKKGGRKMLIKQVMKMILHKTSKDYFLTIKQVQTYYEALEVSYIKRRNPFRMLSPLFFPAIVETDL